MVLFLLCVGATCVLAGQQPQKPDTPESSPTDSTKKPAIKDAVRVSTDEALANVARQKATNKDTDDKIVPSDVVLEFREVTTSAGSSNIGTRGKDSKKPPLKDIHGEGYGLAGAGVNQEGGRAGAKSKDGKTAIYVEADHGGTSPSH